jgi:hypothetical protein
MERREYQNATAAETQHNELRASPNERTEMTFIFRNFPPKK